MNKKDRTVYIVRGRGFSEYVNWCEAKIVDKMEDATFVMGVGGQDVDPQIYGHKKHFTTGSGIKLDLMEIKEIEKAVSLNKPIWGTCRFAQLLGAIQDGGYLIQDLNHPGAHNLTTCEGEVIVSPSCHHQLVCVNDMKEEDYKLLAWGNNVSPYHQNGLDENVELKDGKEAEVVYYRKQNAIGFQGHVEHIWHRRDEGWCKRTVAYAQDLLDKLIEGKM